MASFNVIAKTFIVTLFFVNIVHDCTCSREHVRHDDAQVFFNQDQLTRINGVRVNGHNGHHNGHKNAHNGHKNGHTAHAANGQSTNGQTNGVVPVSRCRHHYAEDTEKAINRQINVYIHADYVYSSMSYPPGHYFRELSDRALPTMSVPELALSQKETHVLAMNTFINKAMSHTYFEQNKRCMTTILLNEGIFFQIVSIGIAKNNPYKKQIQDAMQRLVEGGIVMKLTNDEVIKYKLCQNPENEAVVIEALKMKDFYGVYLLYVGGMMLAVLTFLTEISFCRPKHID